MKTPTLAAILALSLSSIALADEAKVDLTSFVAAGSRTRAAELCGKVTGAKTAPAYVRVVVEEKSNRPGVYNVLVGSDGAFCTTVVSYYGTAVASLWGSQTESTLSLGSSAERQ